MDDDRCYHVLDLQPGASQELVKQAYRDLVKIWHPDRLSADDQRLRHKADIKLKEINEAYLQIMSQFATPAVPVYDVYKADLNTAVQSVAGMASKALAESQALVRRWNGGVVPLADLGHALDSLIAQAEVTSVVTMALIQRVREEASAAGIVIPSLIQMQQNMDETAQRLQQVKARRQGQ